MDKESQFRVASILTVVAGAWALLTPLSISMTGAALTNILIIGGVLVVAGLVQIFWTNVLPSWVIALASAWLFISAYVFTMSTAAIWNQVIVAIIGILLAMWDGIEVNYVQHHHMHA